MVNGLPKFREYFRDFAKNYVLIGGVACDLAMSRAGLSFRATKDLDIVVLVEALDAPFVSRFWEFIDAGGYESCQKSSGRKLFYRFHSPSSEQFPFMLELFSRKPDVLELKESSHLSPLPVPDELSSLSVILMDDDYYSLVNAGRVVSEGVSILTPEFLIPLKMKAWIELMQRSLNGEQIDSHDIKKHRNDVVRLLQIVEPTRTLQLPARVEIDMRDGIERLSRETTLDLKNLGIRNASLSELIQLLKKQYQLED